MGNEENRFVFGILGLLLSNEPKSITLFNLDGKGLMVHMLQSLLFMTFLSVCPDLHT